MKAIIYLALTGLFILQKNNFVFANDQHKDKTKPKAITVSFGTVKQAYWAPQYTTVGTVKSDKYTTIQAPISGYIEKIFINSGAQVKKDEPLFQIYSKTIQASHEQNLAENKLDKSHLDRVQKLYDQKFISRYDYERAKANYQESLNKVKETASQLDLTKVKAPFNAKLGIKKINIGDYVNTGDDLVDIQGATKKDKYHISFMATENIAHNLKIGQKVSVDINNKKLNAYISAIGVGFNNNSRQMMIKAKFTSKQPSYLQNGLTVIITTDSGKPKAVNIVPQTAINYSVAGNSIFKVISGKAKAVPINIGERRDQNASVIGNIKPGDLIVSAGTNKVHNHASVITGSFN